MEADPNSSTTQFSLLVCSSSHRACWLPGPQCLWGSTASLAVLVDLVSSADIAEPGRGLSGCWHLPAVSRQRHTFAEAESGSLGGESFASVSKSGLSWPCREGQRELRSGDQERLGDACWLCPHCMVVVHVSGSSMWLLLSQHQGGSGLWDWNLRFFFFPWRLRAAGS